MQERWYIIRSDVDVDEIPLRASVMPRAAVPSRLKHLRRAYRGVAHRAAPMGGPAFDLDLGFCGPLRQPSPTARFALPSGLWVKIYKYDLYNAVTRIEGAIGRESRSAIRVDGTEYRRINVNQTLVYMTVEDLEFLRDVLDGLIQNMLVAPERAAEAG